MSIIEEYVTAQPRARELLEAAAREPSGSYLFVGPAGVGKAQAARALAAAIVCPESCGTCDVCRRAMTGLHPDVQMFQPEGFTYPVELIREVVAASAQSPLEAERRVFVVEEADRIVERSQNALLKALEEPNATVTWILVAEVLDVFLPTILSRCQIVEFVPVAEGHVRELISKRFDLPETVADQVTRAARGDLELAIALATDEGARRLRSLAVTAATRPGGEAGSYLAVAAEVGAIAQKAREEAAKHHVTELKELEEAAGKGRGVASVRKRLTDRQKRELRRQETEVYLDFLGWLGSAGRDVMAAALRSAPETIVNTDFAAEILEASASRPPQFWLQLVEEANAARQRILENAYAPMVVESVLLTLV